MNRARRTKKSLGQHYLTSKVVIKDMVGASELKKNDIVLEVGPGKGILTKALLEESSRVYAIEKDDSLIPFLEKKFKEEIKEGKLKLLHGDVLNLDLKVTLPKKYVVVANIPYYITGVFLRKMLTDVNQPSKMVLMVQKEIASRILAHDKKESILSISVKVYGKPSVVRKVAKRYFKPVPKVDSAVLKIENISKKFFRGSVTEEKYFEFVKTGFSHKRKLLLNNLEVVCPKGVLQNKFRSCSVPQGSRAENLTINDWLCLVKVVSR